MANIVYLQGGGPTAVINTSFLGVLKAAKEEKANLFCSRYGLEGLISGKLEKIDLDKDYSFLKRRPGSFFGSARISLKKNPEYLPMILKTLKEEKVDLLLLNGGNDTMDSALRIHEACRKENLPVHVLGIPKTIDNDLYGTDRCPGFLSAAKCVIYNIHAILVDDLSYRKGRINVIEVMGRDNGSLAASTSLPLSDDILPDFIYVPEVPFNTKEAIQKAKRVFQEKGRCNIVVSEGIHDEEGKNIAAVGQKDNFGNVQLGGVSSYLSDLFRKEGIKTRGIELSIPQRAAFYLQSDYDLRDAFLCGKMAVKEGSSHSGLMIGIDKTADFSFSYHLADLETASGNAKPMSLSYVSKEKDFIDKSFREDYEELILSSPREGVGF